MYEVNLRESIRSAKTIALMRKVRHRGIEKVGWGFTFAAAPYNLVRVRKLLARPVGAVRVKGRSVPERGQSGRKGPQLEQLTRLRRSLGVVRLRTGIIKVTNFAENRRSSAARLLVP